VTGNTISFVAAALPLLSLAWSAAGPAKAAEARVPVVLDTDIGDDIDDTWALVMILKSPQLDLKLVTTTCGKAEYRAKIVARLLTIARRTDVPVGLGAGGRQGGGGQDAWVKDYQLSHYAGKVHEDGVAALIDAVSASPEPLRIISIGPSHTVAAALERQPAIAGKAIFVGMQGSVRMGYGKGSKPQPEYNVKCNVPAAQKVFAAPWREALITPLDTCGLVQLGGKRFQSLVESRDALVKALLDNYRIWARNPKPTGSSTLFDTVAVYLALPGPKPLVKLEELPIRVTADGMTVIDPAGRKMQVATEWTSLEGYHDWLTQTLLGDGGVGRRAPTRSVGLRAPPTSSPAGGETYVLKIDAEVIRGPESPGDAEAWSEQMNKWFVQECNRIGSDEHQYGGNDYIRKDLAWSRRSFVQPQMMAEERYFYDPVAGKYTVDRYLDDLDRRYGGIDSVLIWPVYPNIGIDNRNQHDLLRAMPGGLPGLRQMVADFHRRGVHVLFPVMPWDTGTRDERVPLCEAAARDTKAIGADGINGDTMGGIPQEFRKAADAVGHPLVLEPENALADLKMLKWNTMSWGYWQYQHVPVVSKYKWLAPWHMVNVCERWAHNRTDGLQSAFFNGVGYESWENVWGIWNQLTPRDAEALRRIAMIQRALGERFVWCPHVPTLQPDVYATRFDCADGVAWLLVNRGDRDADGDELDVAGVNGKPYYDLWHGVALKATEPDGRKVLRFAIEKHGYGAVFAPWPGHELPRSILDLLPKMAERSKTRLADLSNEWKALPQQVVDIPRTRPAVQPPEGMVRVPAGKFRFKVSGVEIEGGDGPGVDFQYPWEDLPRRHHDKELDLKAFYIDKCPVTNAQFKKFLDAAGYKPRDPYNFLKHWAGGTYPAGWDKKPVTWVALEDARAYAAWAGKRLPREWEWQYAAQGTDDRPYPWGTQPLAEATPPATDGREVPPPADVDAHPKGGSPFGVLDMLGNVWQWTDEYTDEHTRAAVLRGGGSYRPKTSMWYFPRNTKLSEHQKYLLMAPSKDRAGTLGFRCVVDAE
jgi:formylglycine-generating enzyme required for sulfatase activity/inosine-uridine nucleoside N-ribohydrolase